MSNLSPSIVILNATVVNIIIFVIYCCAYFDMLPTPETLLCSNLGNPDLVDFKSKQGYDVKLTHYDME
jgi:hypothetical protein